MSSNGFFNRGCTGDFLDRKSKKNWVPHTSKNRNKKQASQANRTTRDNPEITFFVFHDGNQNAHWGQYYAMLPSRSPGFNDDVA
jgi:hypothetical protein